MILVLNYFMNLVVLILVKFFFDVFLICFKVEYMVMFFDN